MQTGIAIDEDSHLQHCILSSLWSWARYKKRKIDRMLSSNGTRNVVDPDKLAIHKVQPEPMGKFENPRNAEGTLGWKEGGSRKKGASPHQDLITCLLGIKNKENEQVLTEKEIIHNSLLVMVAGYDTSSVLITFMVRLLANNPTVHAAVLQGMLLSSNSLKFSILLWAHYHVSLKMQRK